MAFHVGQKVVCICDPVPQPDCPYPIFKKGEIYTVALLEEEYGYVFITVRELHPRVTGEASGFRPVVERETDISVFKAMLNKSPANKETV